MRCLKCRSWLNPDEDACLHCGEPFDPSDPLTYGPKRRARGDWHPKNWLPGFLLATFVGWMTFRVGVEYGFSWYLFLAMPAAVGTILGLTVRGHALPILWFALMCAGAIAWLVYETDGVGIACGLIMLVIIAAPVLLGVLLAYAIRGIYRALKDRRRHNLLLLLAIAPLTLHLLSSRSPREVVTVRTVQEIRVPVETAWRHLMFYEEVEHSPPLLLRLGLPVPLGVSGARARVGDIETCHYESGTLVKRISERVENERLAFEVIEQKIGFEHDLRLIDGSFDLVRCGPDRTLMVLTTRYEPYAYPAWIWRPLESNVIHTLHEHVAEGIRRKARTDWNVARLFRAKRGSAAAQRPH